MLKRIAERHVRCSSAAGDEAALAEECLADPLPERHFAKKQDERISALEQQQAQQAPRPQQAPPPQAASAAGPSVADPLQQITALHRHGALSDEEFSAAKAKLLGG